jgi:CBS domain-containing protein
MSLRAFCQKRVVTISPERSIAEACWIMKDKSVGCLVAENHGKLCGILTDRDIVLKVTGEDKDPLTTMVEEVMTRDPVRISVNRSVRDVVSLMRTKHVRRVPIVDGSDSVLGIITMDDLIGLFGDEMSELGKTVSQGVRRENALQS